MNHIGDMTGVYPAMNDKNKQGHVSSYARPEENVRKFTPVRYGSVDIT
ncbi:hypothetical protein [Spirosoma pomorum]